MGVHQRIDDAIRLWDAADQGVLPRVQLRAADILDSCENRSMNTADLAQCGVLLVFACLSASISVIQEMRSEGVLDALRATTSPRALVIRDGERANASRLERTRRLDLDQS